MCVCVCVIVGKYCSAGLTTHHTRCIPTHVLFRSDSKSKNTDTNYEYLTHIVLPRQQWLRERASEFRRVSTLPDLIYQPVPWDCHTSFVSLYFHPSLVTATRPIPFHQHSPWTQSTTHTLFQYSPPTLPLYGCDYSLSPMFPNHFLPCPGVEPIKPFYPRHGRTSRSSNLIG